MEHLRTARLAVEQLNAGSAVTLVSPVYETEPVECAPGTPPYLNAVIEIGFEDGPRVLLDELRRIELRMGRPSQRTRNASRTIDLDLLYVGNRTVADPDLVIPHPRLQLRRFVLQPLTDIRPDLVLPGFEEPVTRLLELLPARPSVTRIPTPGDD